MRNNQHETLKLCQDSCTQHEGFVRYKQQPMWSQVRISVLPLQSRCPQLCRNSAPLLYVQQAEMGTLRLGLTFGQVSTWGVFTEPWAVSDGRRKGMFNSVLQKGVRCFPALCRHVYSLPVTPVLWSSWSPSLRKCSMLIVSVQTDFWHPLQHLSENISTHAWNAAVLGKISHGMIHVKWAKLSPKHLVPKDECQVSEFFMHTASAQLPSF